MATTSSQGEMEIFQTCGVFLKTNYKYNVTTYFFTRNVSNVTSSQRKTGL